MLLDTTALSRLGRAAGLRSLLGARNFAAEALRKVEDDVMGTTIKNQLDGMREAGTYKVERVLTSPQAPSVRKSLRYGRICCNTLTQWWTL